DAARGQPCAVRAKRDGTKIAGLSPQRQDALSSRKVPQDDPPVHTRRRQTGSIRAESQCPEAAMAEPREGVMPERHEYGMPGRGVSYGDLSVGVGRCQPRAVAAVGQVFEGPCPARETADPFASRQIPNARLAVFSAGSELHSVGTERHLLDDGRMATECG